MARLSSVEADFNKLIMLGMLKAVPQLYQVVRVPVPEHIRLTSLVTRVPTEVFAVVKTSISKAEQSAAEYVKSRLPEVLKQHLQDYEKDKENSVLSYQTILEQQILSIDREMLEKLTVSYDEAGDTMPADSQNQSSQVRTKFLDLQSFQRPDAKRTLLVSLKISMVVSVPEVIPSKMGDGTTCLIALLSDKELTVANVGDSRGVLCDKDGNAIPLSHDHKPYQLKERKRIKRAGGFISFNGSWRVQGILAMSRSLGDYPLKNLNVVIPDPDILTFDLDKLQPEFMILASDGLWDAFSNEEAVRFIKERLDEPHFGAKSIVLQSFYRGCPDNITVMVVKFRNSSKTEEQ
ncbi:Ppm1l [Columba livia]|nr:Ppm1l [Columba livia]